MSLRLRAVRNHLLRIDPSEVLFHNRGFEPSKLQGHMEAIGESFLFGYHLALNGRYGLLGGELDRLDPTYRGFAYEGAAMALGLCDQLSFGRPRYWPDLLQGQGRLHRYVVHVGLGWACARIPWCRRNPEKYTAWLDPLLKWLVIDGFGFHEGYFHWNKQIASRSYPGRLSDYGKRVFDQGLGRSLWFVSGGNPKSISKTLELISPARRPDFSSGLGLAMTYAGQVMNQDIELILATSAMSRAHFAQGVAFGAEARCLAGIANANTELLCQSLWGMPTQDVAALTNTCYPSALDVAGDSPSELYEQWRTNIRELFPCPIHA